MDFVHIYVNGELLNSSIVTSRFVNFVNCENIIPPRLCESVKNELTNMFIVHCELPSIVLSIVGCEM